MQQFRCKVDTHTHTHPLHDTDETNFAGDLRSRAMSRWRLIALPLSVALGYVWTVGGNSSPLNNAGLQPDSAHFQLNVVAGEQKQLLIPVVNRSAASLRIVGVSSSCSCVSTGEFPVTVEPNATFRVPIVVHSTAEDVNRQFAYRLRFYFESGTPGDAAVSVCIVSPEKLIVNEEQ